jgi:hypothetical protein
MSKAENEEERRNQIIAASPWASHAPSFGYDPKNGGGIFHLGYDDACSVSST